MVTTTPAIKPERWPLPGIRTAGILRCASKHVYYEFYMLHGVIIKLDLVTNDKFDDALKNALLESFAIHISNLVNFFYPLANQKPRTNDLFPWEDLPQKADWEGFAPSLSFSAKDIVDRAGKKVAHITIDRAAVHEQDRKWYHDWSSGLLEAARVFAAQGLSERLDEDFYKDPMCVLS